MNGYLLDTCTALIALTNPDKLTTAARSAVLTGPNILSVISYWEVALKSMKGTLDVGDPGVGGSTPWINFPQRRLPCVHSMSPRYAHYRSTTKILLMES